MGNELTLADSGKAVGLRPEITTSLNLYGEWNANRSLYELQQQGIPTAEIRHAAEDAARWIVPIAHNRLVDRLTALGMLLAANRPPAEATIWVRETARLLGDVPEDILGAAIDTELLRSRFLPTVSELRSHVEPELNRRRSTHTRLQRLAELAETGVVIRKVEPKPPEPVRALTSHAPRADVRPRKPTRQDYIDMGVDPATLDQTEQAA